MSLPTVPSIRRSCIMISRLIALLILILTAGAAVADNPDASGFTPAASVTALRLTVPISINGILDEAPWQNSSAAPLVQNDPDNGELPRLRTDWWVAYDDEAIYVAGRLFDSAPDSISRRLGRRDSHPDNEWVYLNLDTFNDDRTGYSFSVNPGGTQCDAALYNDGWDDSSWDGIWSYAVNIDDLGWTVEMRIPFSQLNFPNRDQQVWGINFSRRIHRYSERDELFHRPRDSAGYVRRFPDLIGIQGITPGKRIEVLAYGTGKGAFIESVEGDPYNDGSEYEFNGGLDLHWGLSSNLTLNATFNPDFGQVEVDPSEINLSDTESFFNEKRPFFIEGANIFRFAGDGINSNFNINWWNPDPFYSRRIGRAPQLHPGGNPDVDYDFADTPQGTRILGAGKLSGKLGQTSFGFLSAVTNKETAELRSGSNDAEVLVEPMANYSVIRVKRDRTDGRGATGLLATSVFRDLTSDHARDTLHDKAFSLNLDHWQYLDDDEIWAMRVYLNMSHVTGSKTAITGLQNNSRHYFQRPDTDHVELDAEATSMSGIGGHAVVNKQKGDLTVNASIGALSPGLELNDLGFLPRSDKINAQATVGWSWNEPGRFFRGRYAYLSQFEIYDFSGTSAGGGTGGMVSLRFANFWDFDSNFFYIPQDNNVLTTRGGPAVIEPAGWSWSWNIYSDYRKSFVVGIDGNLSKDDSGHENQGLGLDLTWRPSSSLKISAYPHYSRNLSTMRYFTAVADAGMPETYDKRYIFSDLDYRQFSLSTRIDWTFSPRLTLQAFFRPLIGVGDYRDFKWLERAGTADFAHYGQSGESTSEYDADSDEITLDPDGASGATESTTISNPDFNSKSLQVNMVLRWEYQPGSAFYLVWTQDRMNYSNPGDFDLGRDLDNLIEAPGDNIFMAKVTKWFDV
ncbi:MAG: carbohydrate binding family 9 domain-containing protein [bacterium]|nr:carbohydrate binding family 9 domain-containing protein [bacterium]